MPTITDRQAPNSYFKPKTRNSKHKYIGANIRQSIEQVFNGLNGWEGMMAWAKKNPDMFYGSVVPKLLPHELAESGLGSNIRVVVYGASEQIPSNLSPITIESTPQPVVVAAEAGDEHA